MEALAGSYVLPPGIEQELDNTTTYVRRQNEQSLVLKHAV